MKWIAHVVLCIAIISLTPAGTTIGTEPLGSTRIPEAIGSHAAVNELWSTLVASTVYHLPNLPQGSLPRAAREPGNPSVTPNRPGEYRIAEKDTLLEPGTLLLFGMGLIALTYGWKYQMFKR